MCPLPFVPHLLRADLSDRKQQTVGNVVLIAFIWQSFAHLVMSEKKMKRTLQVMTRSCTKSSVGQITWIVDPLPLESVMLLFCNRYRFLLSTLLIRAGVIAAILGTNASGARASEETLSKHVAAKKQHSIEVANSLQREIVVRINRRPTESVAVGRGTQTHLGKRHKFSVTVWIVRKNGSHKRIFQRSISTSEGNGNGHVKVTIYRNNRGQITYRAQ